MLHPYVCMARVLTHVASRVTLYHDAIHVREFNTEPSAQPYKDLEIKLIFVENGGGQFFRVVHYFELSPLLHVRVKIGILSGNKNDYVQEVLMFKVG